MLTSIAELRAFEETDQMGIEEHIHGILNMLALDPGDSMARNHGGVTLSSWIAGHRTSSGHFPVFLSQLGH